MRRRKILCPDCRKLKLKSVSEVQGGITTLMGWCGAPEKDPNISTTKYTCSNGHTFYISYQYGKQIENRYSHPEF
jgi:hypothetical protein